MGLFDFGFSYSKGGGTSVPQSKELMQFQSDQWRGNTEWFNKNGYALLRQGLINADYNPLLAIGSSPLNGEMPNATATEGTTAFSGNITPSANMQANTARKISDSQIGLNNATAQKAREEALTQENVRTNLDSQSALNNIETLWKQKHLPLSLKLIGTQIELNKYISENYRANTAYTNKQKEYVGYNSETARISANAAKTGAEFTKEWTPKAAAIGIGAGLLGLAPLGYGKIKSLFKKPVGFRTH